MDFFFLFVCLTIHRAPQKLHEFTCKMCTYVQIHEIHHNLDVFDDLVTDVKSLAVCIYFVLMVNGQNKSSSFLKYGYYNCNLLALAQKVYTHCIRFLRLF